LTKAFEDEDLEFEDEMRVGTRTELGRKWAPIGVRPLGKQQIGYEYLYLYVALKPYTGELFAMFLPRLDKQCFGIFGKARSKSLKKKTLWVVDGASAHRLEPENRLLVLQKIPPYAPELNPVERFFEELRRRMKFRIFESLDEAEECLSEVLQRFYNDAERVKSLTLFPYITYARNNLN
jgi:putative transposase